MKKFQFSLDRMLSYKEQILTAQKNKLAQCNIRRNEIEAAIENNKKEAASLAEKLFLLQKRGSDIRNIKLLTYQIEANHMLLEQLESELAEAILAVERQLKVVLAATQEVEGLVKLKDKQYEDFLYEENKAEQLIVSEFVASKIIRDKKLAQDDRKYSDSNSEAL